MFSLIYAWINTWVNNGVAGDLRRHRTHHDAIVLFLEFNAAPHSTFAINSLAPVGRGSNFTRGFSNSFYENWFQVIATEPHWW